MVLLLTGTSCTVPPTVTTRTGRALTLPSVPVTDRPGIRIDPGHIDEAACDRCEAAGAGLGVEELMAWAGSYSLGLAAPAGGPLPALDCPEA